MKLYSLLTRLLRTPSGRIGSVRLSCFGHVPTDALGHLTDSKPWWKYVGGWHMSGDSLVSASSPLVLT